MFKPGASHPVLEALRLPTLWVRRSLTPASTPVLSAPAQRCQEDWQALKMAVSQCQRCGLCKTRTQTVFGDGDEHANWMWIGEGPGYTEDQQGLPFVGPAGKLLDNMLGALGLSRQQNVYIANVVKCRPPGNRDPEPDEVEQCKPYLQAQLDWIRPKIIVALGRVAAQNLLQTSLQLGQLRQKVYDYEGIPLIVTYHPAYLLRNPQDKAKVWADLCFAKQTFSLREFKLGKGCA